ncbi:MAG: UTRA domain-containing protein [Beijerinckiaceae bacterium]
MNAPIRKQVGKSIPVDASEATPVTLNQLIRDDIIGRIRSGEWAPGHRLPFEHEMMATYNCSRMTVSKALSALSEQGLISRRRRAGSIVSAPSAERAVLQITDFALEAKRQGKAYRHEVLSRTIEPADAATAKRLGLKTEVPLLAIVTLHHLEGMPEAYEERLVNLAAVPTAREEKFLDVPVGTWLLQRVPWSDAEHVIRAENADAKLAGLLGIAPSAACLVVERRTWHGGIFLTEARLFHGGLGHQLVGRFSPTGNADFRTKRRRK